VRARGLPASLVLFDPVVFAKVVARAKNLDVFRFKKSSP
jgi:hypothetical protein